MKPSVPRRLWGWLLDYCYLLYWMVRGFFSRSSPADLLRPDQDPRTPIVLIPGVYEHWRFMQPIAAHLYRAGHPVHVLEKLGYNTGAIPAMAVILSDYLKTADATDVVLIAHSKGGLIGKQALGDPDTVARVKHLIAINTPFAGSRYANLFLLPSVRMFMPKGAVIQQLALNLAINQHISSLYSVFDPHIPETSHLEGAENIVLPSIGHFRPVGDAVTLETIDRILARVAHDQPAAAPES
ncbi:MAG TPA: alpha/beta fold hydrolase [Propionibacteriaceae bacterium]|nr:alpha/beta fold hydrolase [Propionibacteriaceae bacterium]